MYFVFNLDKWNDNIDSFLSFLTTKYKKRNRIYLHICSMIKNLQTEQNSNISLQIISTLSHFPFRSIRSKKRKKEREKKPKKKLSGESIRMPLPLATQFSLPTQSLSSKKVNSSSFSLRTALIITPSLSLFPFLDGLVWNPGVSGPSRVQGRSFRVLFRGACTRHHVPRPLLPYVNPLAACDRGRPNGYLTNLAPVTPD